MRAHNLRCLVQGALVCVVLLVGGQGAAAFPQESGRENDAAAMREFTQGVARYVALRARLEEPLPAFDDARRDAWSVMLTRRYLGSAIRTARGRAGISDIFTAPVAAMFRGLIAEAIYDEDIEGLVDGDLGRDGALVDLVVNEPLPAWAIEAVPDALLTRLPPLPDAIEYGVVGGSLILWDSHAEILVDALPGAFWAD
jgi:hypothetical protein